VNAQPEPKQDAQERKPRKQRTDVETVVPFDTLNYAKRLQSANVPPEQAEVQAEAIRQILVATKVDVDLAAERVIDYTELKTERINTNMVLSINRVDSDMREAFKRTDGHIRDVKTDLKGDIARESEQLNKTFTDALRESQASNREAIASVLREAQASNREAIATLRAEMKDGNASLTRWIIGTGIAVLGLALAYLTYKDSAASRYLPAVQQPAPVTLPAPVPVQPAQPDQPATPERTP